MEKKYLFLDLDGVMVTNAIYYRKKSSFYDGYPFDKGCVKILNEILILSSAKIILSSDWKNYFNMEELKNIFLSNGVIDFPIDITPFSKDYEAGFLECGRSEEIKEYLNIHKPDKWVVVDDLDMSEYLTNFVGCFRGNEGIKQTSKKEKILKYLL